VSKKEAVDWRQLMSEQIRQHKQLFFRLAYGVLRNADQSEDACQQALLKAWRCREEIRDHTALRGWLSRTVIHESLTILRRRQTEKRILSSQVQPQNTSVDPAESVSLRDLVVAGLDGLKEPARTVVVLRTMQGMSGNEVSQILEISLSEVSRRLHQGLEQLRSFISAQHR
jgi:RNA polymerase sigma-70 factor (ECF subfamily)